MIGSYSALYNRYATGQEMVLKGEKGLRPKKLKKCMKLIGISNFPSIREIGIFLELYIVTSDLTCFEF